MRHNKKIVLGLFIFFLSYLCVSPQASANAIQWPVKTDSIEAIPDGIHANVIDNISLVDCSTDSASHPNLSEHFGDTYSTTITNNASPKFPCLGNEGYGQVKTIADGTFYTYSIVMVNGQPEDRLAAIRNNQVLWSTDITSNDLCGNGDRSIPLSISVGPNGNVYAVITSNIISNCATYIAGFDGKTGSQIFKQYITNRTPPNSSTTSWTFAGRLWTYDDKILLVDTNGMEREYDYSGIENTSARYQFPNVPNTGAYGRSLLANQEGRVFVVYRTVWGCYPNVDGTYIRYHDANGTSGTSSLNLGCDNPNYSYKPTHDGNLAAYGYNGNLLIAHMTDNSHFIGNFSTPSGYTKARVINYWEDTAGNGVLVRQLTDANGLRTITADDVNISSGTLTNVGSVASNASYSLGDTFKSMGDASDGYLYLALCHTNCNSSTDRANNTWIHRLQLSGFGTPIKDTGQLVNIAENDVDNDGLTLTQETSQGTSDHITDTDGDGLSDYAESAIFPDRNTVFCGDANTICNNYPNPTQKDLYVEIDWMKDPSSNESFMPTSTQLNEVSTAYAAKGIIAHFDTGAYGGGNELPSYTPDLYFASTSSHVDFYDYKNGSTSDGISSNFSPNRYHIWHYMISGYQYHDTTGSSGVSYAGDDDSFISYGLIEHHPFDFSYADLDDAIAGTIIHELGHDSCLSQTSAYTNQPSDCVYSGIDDINAPSTYASSMNYGLQMYIVDYSTGANGPSIDHNDWSAIDKGMGDFTSSNQGAETNGKKASGRMRVGITLQKARELRRQGRLGLLKKNGITKSLLPVKYRISTFN